MKLYPVKINPTLYPKRNDKEMRYDLMIYLHPETVRGIFAKFKYTSFQLNNN